jgi:hypothetical protein
VVLFTLISHYMPHPFHPPWLDHSNYTWQRVQITQFLIMQFSPPSCHLIPLWSKYFPQHPVLKHPQCTETGTMKRRGIFNKKKKKNMVS